MLFTNNIMQAYCVIAFLVATVGVCAATNLHHSRQAETAVNGACVTGQVACNGQGTSGSCIRLTRLCDGRADCADNWDETPSVCDSYENMAASNPDYCDVLMWRQCRSYVGMSLTTTSDAMYFSNVMSQPASYTCSQMSEFGECMEEWRRRICPNIPLDEMGLASQEVQFFGKHVQYACNQHFEEFVKAQECALKHLTNGLNLAETAFLTTCRHINTINPANAATNTCEGKAWFDCVIGVAEQYCDVEVARFVKGYIEFNLGCSLDD